MATKKQKHAAAMAKREKFMADLKADGLAALKASQAAAKKRSEGIKAVAEGINERHRGILRANGIFDTKSGTRPEKDEQPPLNMLDYTGD